MQHTKRSVSRGVVTPGSGEIAVDRVGGESVVTKSIAASPLRLLTTRARGDVAWVVTTTLGGGIVDGDAIDLSVRVGAGARGLVTTQSSTKAYRSPRGAKQRLSADAGEGAIVALANDPLVPFADAEHDAAIDVTLAETGSALVVDAFTAGRSARGERWAFRRLVARLRLARGGRSIVDEATLLDPRHGDVAGRMARFDVLVTALVAGPALSTVSLALADDVSRARLRRDAKVLVAASRLAEDVVLLRVAAGHVEEAMTDVRARLAPAFAALGCDPWARRR